MIGIYCIENIVNGKKYIGQSENLERRMSVHKSCLRGGYHENNYLQRAWSKYGEINFKIFILVECQMCELDEREKFFIQHYKSAIEDFGYNLEGGGRNGKWISEISKTLMSRARKGKVPSGETRKKLSEAGRGRVLSEEARMKIKNSKIGLKHTNETKKKISESKKEWYRTHKNPNTGIKRSSETLVKMSLASKGKKMKENAIALLKKRTTGNKYNLGRKQPREEVERRADSIRKAWENKPKVTGKTQSEETKLKMSKAQKLRWAIRKQNKLDITGDR